MAGCPEHKRESRYCPDECSFKRDSYASVRDVRKDIENDFVNEKKVPNYRFGKWLKSQVEEISYLEERSEER